MKTLQAMLVVALIVVGYALAGGSHRTASAAMVGYPTWTCYGSSEVTFNWVADGSGSQWVDLSLFNNGFASGTYLGAGPLHPWQQSLTWGGIISGLPHYWRVTTLTAQGWHVSATGSFTPCTASAPPPPAAPIGWGSLEGELADAHNTERARAGLGRLAWDESLARVADARAFDMASKGYFSHTSPSGETVFALLAGNGIGYGLAGENIARNNYADYESAGVAFSGFMNSPGHRANILESRFSRIGIAVAVAGDMKYFAVVFAGP